MKVKPMGMPLDDVSRVVNRHQQDVIVRIRVLLVQEAVPPGARPVHELIPHDFIDDRPCGGKPGGDGYLSVFKQA